MGDVNAVVQVRTISPLNNVICDFESDEAETKLNIIILHIFVYFLQWSVCSVHPSCEYVCGCCEDEGRFGLDGDSERACAGQ